MTNEALDRILTREDGILPSSGFTARVMERVRSDAITPQPIPFPWKRALPGLTVAGLTVGSVLVGCAEVVRNAWNAPPAATETLATQISLHATVYAEATSIAVAFFLSLAALKLAMRLAAS